LVLPGSPSSAIGSCPILYFPRHYNCPQVSQFPLWIAVTASACSSCVSYWSCAGIQGISTPFNVDYRIWYGSARLGLTAMSAVLLRVSARQADCL
jgi:hypothetical protein